MPLPAFERITATMESWIMMDSESDDTDGYLSDERSKLSREFFGKDVGSKIFSLQQSQKLKKIEEQQMEHLDQILNQSMKIQKKQLKMQKKAKSNFS